MIIITHLLVSGVPLPQTEVPLHLPAHWLLPPWTCICLHSSGLWRCIWWSRCSPLASMSFHCLQTALPCRTELGHLHPSWVGTMSKSLSHPKCWRIWLVHWVFLVQLVKQDWSIHVDSHPITFTCSFNIFHILILWFYLIQLKWNNLSK